MRVVLLGLVLSVGMCFGACTEPRSVQCGDGRVCPASYACDDAHKGCASLDQVKQCDGQPELTPCSYPGVSDGACYDGVCLPGGCGNGTIDAPEVCDDRNRLHGDGCSADCLSTEVCGNGVIDAVKGEACDDGNTADGDGCQANCASPTCGDGVIDPQYNEKCDDGAANADTPNAACRTNCQRRRCGDGQTDTVDGEACDDGN